MKPSIERKKGHSALRLNKGKLETFDPNPSPLTGYMKCAYCSWKTKRWTTGKDGKKKPGNGRLLHHVEIAHHDEYMKLFKRLEEEFPAENSMRPNGGIR